MTSAARVAHRLMLRRSAAARPRERASPRRVAQAPTIAVSSVCLTVSARVDPAAAPVLSPHLEQLVCPDRSPPAGADVLTLSTFEQRERYRAVLPPYLARLSAAADEVLLMPVVAATSGLVYEVSDRFRGGRSVMNLGPRQRRYVYSRLDASADTLSEGMWVGAVALLGFNGNDGSAATTPPHLPCGACAFGAARYRFVAYDPLPFKVDATPASDPSAGAPAPTGNPADVLTRPALWASSRRPSTTSPAWAMREPAPTSRDAGSMLLSPRSAGGRWLDRPSSRRDRTLAEAPVA